MFSVDLADGVGDGVGVEVATKVVGSAEVGKVGNAGVVIVEVDVGERCWFDRWRGPRSWSLEDQVQQKRHKGRLRVCPCQ